MNADHLAFWRPTEPWPGADWRCVAIVANSTVLVVGDVLFCTIVRKASSLAFVTQNLRTDDFGLESQRCDPPESKKGSNSVYCRCFWTFACNGCENNRFGHSNGGFERGTFFHLDPA